MTRLAEAGVVSIQWEEDEEEGMIFAEGLQSYEVDKDNELAVFNGKKCVKVHQCVDIFHAISMIEAGEAVCRWNIKNGRTGNGHKINERGWDIGGRA
jgi:hypothetical protein